MSDHQKNKCSGRETARLQIHQFLLCKKGCTIYYRLPDRCSTTEILLRHPEKQQMNSDPYHSIAPFYDRLVSPLLHPLRRDIATYIRFRGYRKVIDVCCGTGAQLRLLDAPGMQLSGIDNSLAMLEQAKRKSPDSIEFHLLDAEQTSFAPGTFDCAIISFSLHEKHPGAALAVFTHSRQMVRPGGSLILSDFSRVPATVSGFLYGRLMIPMVERLAGALHYRMYRQWLGQGALEGLLSRQGGASDVICRPFARCVLCCAMDIEATGLSLENGLALLNRAITSPTLPTFG